MSTLSRSTYWVSIEAQWTARTVPVTVPSAHVNVTVASNAQVCATGGAHGSRLPSESFAVVADDLMGSEGSMPSSVDRR